VAKSYDRISISDLTCRCIVGINPDERLNKQDVILNIVLEADLHAACESDRIEDTIDYKSIKLAVLALVENSSFFLIERLAQRIAETCFLDPRVKIAHVSVDKPGALRFARSVSVSITRTRDGHA